MLTKYVRRRETDLEIWDDASYIISFINFVLVKLYENSQEVVSGYICDFERSVTKPVARRALVVL